MSDEPLDLERSAFLVNLKQEIERLERRVEELEEEDEGGPTLSEDLHSFLEQNATITSVLVDEETIKFDLSDDRTVSIPLWWSWELERAESDERKNYEIEDEGNRVVWPDVGEEITVHGILTGEPAPRPDEAS